MLVINYQQGMIMATPIYPSLSSYAGALTSPEEVIPSILRYMFESPAGHSDYYRNSYTDYKLSFRRIEADYGSQPQALITKLTNELQAVFDRYFKNEDLRINIYYKLITEDGKNEEVEPTEDVMFLVRYNVYIDIVRVLDDGLTQGVITKGRISINHEEHTFHIDFDKEVY